MHVPACIFWANLTAFSLQLLLEQPLDVDVQAVAHGVRGGAQRDDGGLLEQEPRADIRRLECGRC